MIVNVINKCTYSTYSKHTVEKLFEDTVCWKRMCTQSRDAERINEESQEKDIILHLRCRKRSQGESVAAAIKSRRVSIQPGRRSRLTAAPAAMKLRVWHFWNGITIDILQESQRIQPVIDADLMRRGDSTVNHPRLCKPQLIIILVNVACFGNKSSMPVMRALLSKCIPNRAGVV